MGGWEREREGEKKFETEREEKERSGQCSANQAKKTRYRDTAEEEGGRQ